MDMLCMCLFIYSIYIAGESATSESHFTGSLRLNTLRDVDSVTSKRFQLRLACDSETPGCSRSTRQMQLASMRKKHSQSADVGHNVCELPIFGRAKCPRNFCFSDPKIDVPHSCPNSIREVAIY